MCGTGTRKSSRPYRLSIDRVGQPRDVPGSMVETELVYACSPFTRGHCDVCGQYHYTDSRTNACAQRPGVRTVVWIAGAASQNERCHTGMGHRQSRKIT